MKRRLLLRLLLGVVAVGLPDAGWARPLAQDDEVVTAGIGLGRDDWEAEHGAGDAAQNYVAYEGGAYYVQFQADVVSFLEFGWADSGVTFEEAESAVRDLLPSDAELDESFSAPATAGGPISFLLHRYQSPALVDVLSVADAEPTGGILVLYQETPAPDRFEPNVSRVSIAVGSAP